MNLPFDRLGVDTIDNWGRRATQRVHAGPLERARIDRELRRSVNGCKARSPLALSTMVNLSSERSLMITDRQREVVALIAAGCSNDEVGVRLGISPRTVKSPCDVLRQKLGVARRRQIPIAYRELTGDDPLARSLGA